MKAHYLRIRKIQEKKTQNNNKKKTPVNTQRKIQTKEIREQPINEIFKLKNMLNTVREENNRIIKEINKLQRSRKFEY